MNHGTGQHPLTKLGFFHDHPATKGTAERDQR